jgi:hypothetical protein
MRKKKPLPAPKVVFANDEELRRHMAEQIANAKDMTELVRLMRDQAIEMRENNRR